MKNTFLLCTILFICLALLIGCTNMQMNKAQKGSVFGALAGGLLGSQLGPDSQREENALIGAGLGFLAGYIIGNEMDKYDRRQVSKTLEYNTTGQTNSWVNPDTGNRFLATPGPAYAQEGRIYRDIELLANVDGERETVQAKAYRQNNRWVLVQ